MATERPWYDVLGVSPFADDEEIRDAYLRLVKAWHPDRFADSPAASALAQERLKEINGAYDVVKASPGAHPDVAPASWAAAAPRWAEPEEPAGPSLLFARGTLLVRLVALLLAFVFVVGGVVSSVRALVRGNFDARRPARTAPLPAR